MFSSFLNPYIPTPEQVLENVEDWVRKGDIEDLVARVIELATVNPVEFRRGLNESYEHYFKEGRLRDLGSGSDSYELGARLASVIDLLSDVNIEWQTEDINV